MQGIDLFLLDTSPCMTTQVFPAPLKFTSYKNGILLLNVCVCYFDGKIDGLNSSFPTPPRQPIYYKHLCLGTLPAPQ